MSEATTISREFYDTVSKMGEGDIAEIKPEFAPPVGTVHSIARKLGVRLRYVAIPKAKKIVIIRVA